MKEKQCDAGVLAAVRAVFEDMVAIPDDEWRFAAQFLHEMHFRKNEYLIRAGEVTSHSFIIINGLVRSYYLTGPGKEFNVYFAMEHMAVGSLFSMVLQEPSKVYVQAMEQSVTVPLYRKNIEALYKRHPCWERLGRLFAERALIYGEIKSGEILDSLETRYLRFIQQFPDLVERIPQYHIASYLGVTDVALSRLRKRIKDKSRR